MNSKILIGYGETIKMDTGNSNLYTFDEYKDICREMGMVRNWQFELAYKMYLKYSSGDMEEIRKATLMVYYNTMYFIEGGLN